MNSGSGLPAAGTAHMADQNRLDLENIRKDFPILARRIYEKPLVYLDNAASSQKPRQVIDAMERFYSSANSNVHRGVHWLSQEATSEFEGVREKLRRFLNASESRELIFVRGTTEAINLVAHSYGGRFLKPGDEIVITGMEHHSNIVPWQLLCEIRGCVLRVVPIDIDGEISLDDYRRLMGPKTRLVAVTHVSNSLGTINPVEDMVEIAHEIGAHVLIDGAQAVAHQAVDVRQLDCDFYCFSSHKMFGPTGVGVLYGKASLLEAMPPYQSGGDMIRSVSFEKTTFNVIPYKFEAGTPNIAGAIGLGAAIDYLDRLGFENIVPYEHELLEYATTALSAIPGLKIIGNAREKASVLSFVLDSIHPHDVGTILDQEGICIRTGHHCAQPVMDRFGVVATARASLAFYNTRDEIDALVKGIYRVKEVFG